MYFKSVFGALCLLAATSCSVKEERSFCPWLIWLIVDADECFAERSVLEFYDSRGWLAYEEGSDRCRVVLERDGEEITAWYGNRVGGESEMRHSVEGEDLPELYFGRKAVVSGGEKMADTIRLHKRYCRLSLRLKRPEGVDLGMRYKATFSGNVTGYAVDGTPDMGKFLCEREFPAMGSCGLCIPRQVDGSLELTITSSNGVVNSFPLGEYLLACGFDWDAEDLGDVEVVLDYGASSLTLITDCWERAVSFEITV